ncbi:MAG: hypothetical protein QNJ47_19940 [Nostocaceae cyanobacterium]|nr:hypothetical protein [Nostocaceae cyanobacterium]
MSSESVKPRSSDRSWIALKIPKVQEVIDCKPVTYSHTESKITVWASLAGCPT